VSRNTNPESVFRGFDTFTGLPEDWGRFKAGTFNVGGNIPDIPDPRCTFHKGLFQETLPGVLTDPALRSRLVIHCDADLYTSTLFVLLELRNLIKPGDVLIFDDLFSVMNSNHEFRALLDFRALFPVDLEPIGKTPGQAAYLVKSKPAFT
jgi:O-methyltransferase